MKRHLKKKQEHVAASLLAAANADVRCGGGGGGRRGAGGAGGGGSLGMETLREVTNILFRVERAHWQYQDQRLPARTSLPGVY